MDTSLAKTITALFGIQDIESISRINAGYLTENSLVKAGDSKYFLKQHRETALSKIQYIEAVEIFFYTNSIPVLMPLKQKTGESHFLYNEKIYTLYPYIKDQQYKRHELTIPLVITLSGMLANMHLISRDRVPSILLTNDSESWDKDKSLKKLDEIERLILRKDKTDGFDLLAKETISIKKKLISQNLLMPDDFDLPNDTLIHGDYHEQNVFFDKSGEISYIFDFEKAKKSYRGLELVRSMMLICFDHHYEEGNFKKAEAYLKNYNSMYPIDRQSFEDSLLMHVTKSFHSTWIEGEHYLNGNEKLDDLLQGNLDTLRYMAGSFNEFRAKILSYLQ